jgi:hypothetical protein
MNYCMESILKHVGKYYKNSRKYFTDAGVVIKMTSETPTERGVLDTAS